MTLLEKQQHVEAAVREAGLDVQNIRSLVTKRDGKIRRTDPKISWTNRDEVAALMTLRLVRMNVGILRMRNPMSLLEIDIDGSADITPVMMVQMRSSHDLPSDTLDTFAMLLILEQIALVDMEVK